MGELVDKHAIEVVFKVWHVGNIFEKRDEVTIKLKSKLLYPFFVHK